MTAMNFLCFHLGPFSLGCDGSPVKFLSSSRDDDLISVSYESVSEISINHVVIEPFDNVMS